MNNRQLLSWAFVTLFASTSLAPALCLPSEGRPEFRKFAEKPNHLKKVAKLDSNDLDDVSTTSSIAQEGGGFSWSNMLAMIMQMIFNPATQNMANKSDLIETDQGNGQTNILANILSIGLKIVTAFLGGSFTPPNDGIDKVDNGGGSPMQGILAAVLSAVLGSKDPDQVASMAKQAGEFINIVVNLLDALKTSFSHRSLTARSIGSKDTISEAAVAGLSLMKGFVRTLSTNNESCMSRFICEANKECSKDSAGSNTIFCQLGNYATISMVERTSTGKYETFYEAARLGRSGEDCQSRFLECNEV